MLYVYRDKQCDIVPVNNEHSPNNHKQNLIWLDNNELERNEIEYEVIMNIFPSFVFEIQKTLDHYRFTGEIENEAMFNSAEKANEIRQILQSNGVFIQPQHSLKTKDEYHSWVHGIIGSYIFEFFLQLDLRLNGLFEHDYKVVAYKTDDKKHFNYFFGEKSIKDII